MPVALVSDTSSNLPYDMVNTYNLIEVPPYVVWRGRTMRERFDIDGETLLHGLANSFDEDLPTTSEPPVGDFRRVYEAILGKDPAVTIFSLHVSSGLSGTLGSAQQAADLFPGADIRVVDTRSCTAGQAMLILSAARMVADGVQADAIEEHLNYMAMHSQTFLIPATLDILAVSGRLWRLARLYSAQRGRAALVEMDDGGFTGDTYPDRMTAQTELIARAQAVQGAVDQLVVSYSGDDAEARTLLHDLRAALKPRHEALFPMGAVFSYYLGEGSLAAAWFEG